MIERELKKNLATLFQNNYLQLPEGQKVQGSVEWQSPSNIALIKYWGKRTGQIPRNPSLSLTLSEAKTITRVLYQTRKEGSVWIHFRFEDKIHRLFEDKIERFFLSLEDWFPFLGQLQFSIDSKNSFPHSSGIASSASAMSALALCLCDIEKNLFPSVADKHFFEKASFISRMGSGSASRSVYGKVVVWGRTPDVLNSTDDYGIQLEDIHPVFNSFHDDIAIVSSAKKEVSSSQGHKLMEGHPLARCRYEQARGNLKNLLTVMSKGHLDTFIRIVEEEAMALHALMMCSSPSYVLMRPNTLKIIEEIRKFRQDRGIPICFSLDAGPNVHILYPDNISKKVSLFLKDKILPHTEEERIIGDRVGCGPKKIL